MRLRVTNLKTRFNFIYNVFIFLRFRRINYCFIRINFVYEWRVIIHNFVESCNSRNMSITWLCEGRMQIENAFMAVIISAGWTRRLNNRTLGTEEELRQVCPIIWREQRGDILTNLFAGWERKCDGIHEEHKRAPLWVVSASIKSSYARSINSAEWSVTLFTPLLLC